jgi:hypothetical protein
VHDTHVDAEQDENNHRSEDVPGPQFGFAHDFLLFHHVIKICAADDHEHCCNNHRDHKSGLSRLNGRICRSGFPIISQFDKSKPDAVDCMIGESQKDREFADFENGPLKEAIQLPSFRAHTRRSQNMHK